MSTMEDARIVRTKQALQAALLALIERKALENITIREIAVEAGVHYTTFYRHHTTKESLLDDIAAEQIRCLVELTTPVVYEADGQTVHLTLCQYVKEHRKLWTILLTGGAAGMLKQELIRLCIDTAEDLVPKGIGIPVELIVISTVGVVIDILAWWLTQPEKAISVERVAAIMDQLVYTALK